MKKVTYEIYFKNLKERKLPRFIKKRLYHNTKIDFLNYAQSLVKPKETILNCACGDNTLKDVFPQAKYIGFDKCVSKKDYKYNNIDITGDAHYLSKYIDEADNIISFGTLEHVENPYKVIREFSKVLKTNGNLFISTPYLSKIHLEPYDNIRFTKYGLVNLLEKNNFKIIKLEDYGGVFTVISIFVRDVFMKLPKALNYFFTVFVWIPLQIISVKLDKYDKSRRHTIGYCVHAVKKNFKKWNQ